MNKPTNERERPSTILPSKLPATTMGRRWKRRRLMGGSLWSCGCVRHVRCGAQLCERLGELCVYTSIVICTRARTTQRLVGIYTSPSMNQLLTPSSTPFLVPIVFRVRSVSAPSSFFCFCFLPSLLLGTFDTTLRLLCGVATCFAWHVSQIHNTISLILYANS